MMAKPAFSSIFLPCLAPSFYSSCINAPPKCILPSKFYHCSFLQPICKQHGNYSPTDITVWRNTQRSLHSVQTAIQAQAHPGTQMVQEDSQFAKTESSMDEDPYVEVGYICNVHGLLGEVRVVPSTDFPEERFAKPGVRWLRLQRYGDVTIEEFELVGGRSHSKKDHWLVSFKGVDTVDQAKELVGATMLVRDDDRPTLDDDEYFSRDLVGMSVVLKDTNKLVGTVAGVFNTGASDLLRVTLIRTEAGVAGTRSRAKGEMSAPQIWIPFVQNIVPDVDIQKRQIHITPPEGLLELNVRPEGLTSREKRQKEFKQKRKIRQKVAAVKKKLSEMGQEHILCGLSTGNEAQRQALLDQILNFDFKLFKYALKASSGAYERSNLSQFLDTNLTRNWWLSLEHMRKMPSQFGRKGYMNNGTLQLQRKGLELIAQGQIAVILLMDEEKLQNMNIKNETTGDQRVLPLQDWFHPQAEQLLTIQKLANSGSAETFSIPIILVATKDTISSVQSIFEEHDYFGLQEEQVWFFTQDSLPCVSSSSEKGGNKILMESPWKIIEAPTGPGGIFSPLVAQGILQRLTERGIQYVQICALNDICVVADPVLFGLMHKERVDIGVKLFAEEFQGQSERPASTSHLQLEPHRVPYHRGETAYVLISKEASESDDAQAQFFSTVHKGNACLNLILSMKYLEKLTKNLYKMEYYKKKTHVGNIQEENEEIENAYQLESSIYSLLKLSSSDKIALVLYH